MRIKTAKKLLIQIDGKPMTYSDFLRKQDRRNTSVLHQLKTAESYGWLSTKSAPSRRGKPSLVYTLTPRGRRFLDLLYQPKKKKRV